MNSYFLHNRLKTLEKTYKETSKRVIVVYPKGKFLYDSTGKRIEQGEYKTIIVCDIPRGNSG